MRSMRFICVVALAIILAGSTATTEAASSMLLGTIGAGGTPSTLVELSPYTGAVVRVIGPVGYVVNGMEYDATTGVLYGSTSCTDPVYNGLITIDMDTGAGTPIGANHWGLDPDCGAVVDLSVTSGGQLYGWFDWGPSATISDDLVIIDTATGLATQVGDSGLSTARNSIAFDSGDVLYHVNSGGTVDIIDTTTGLPTYVGELGTTAHHGDIDLASGYFYGISSVSNPRDLVVADVATATVVTTLPTVDDLHTLTFVPRAPLSWDARMLLGTTGYGGTPSTLVEVSPYTGAIVRVIGPVGYGINGMDYDELSGTLYGATRWNDPYNGLVTIDMETGAATTVGVHGWGLYPGGVPITNLKADTKGQLFGWSEWSDQLVRIDKATGLATTIGVSPLSTLEYGLGFDGEDNLYLVNAGGPVYQVDPVTGSAAATGANLGQHAHHGDFDLKTGRYYGLTYTFPNRDVVVADLATGTVVALLPPSNAELHTLAFVPRPVTEWQSSILVGTVGFGGGTTTTTLVHIDADDGSLVRTIGSIPHVPNGLAWNDASQTLYATTSYNDPSFVGLMEVDPLSAAVTPIGAGWSAAVTNLAADAAGDLFAWCEFGIGGASDDLVRVDPATGVATEVGDAGIWTFEYGLVFDGADDLTLVNGGGTMYSVDPVLGAATTSAVSFPQSLHHSVVDFSDGLLYGLNWTPSGIPRDLLVGDMSTGTVLAQYPTGLGLHTLATLPGGGPTLLGTIGRGTTLSTLVEIDPSTGELEREIGPVGYVVNGLEYDATTGVLYGGTSIQDPSYNGLIEIDMATGAGTAIGVNGWGLGGAPVTNITVDSAGNMYGWSEWSDDLVSIDKATGVATVVGDSGVATQAYSLAFGPDDTLYLVNYDWTWTIDPATGAATSSGVSFAPFTHHGDIDANGVFYGVKHTLAWGPPAEIFVGDVSTGVQWASLPFLYSDLLHTLTFGPPTLPGPTNGTVMGDVLTAPVVSDPTGSDVQAVETLGGTVVGTTATDGMGHYSLDLPADNYDIYVSRNNFLWGVYNTTVNAGSAVTLPTVTILGGDVTGDDTINIVDISSIATNFGNPGPAGDVNEDGTVNIVDLAGAAANFGESSPVPWM